MWTILWPLLVFGGLVLCVAFAIWYSGASEDWLQTRLTVLFGVAGLVVGGYIPFAIQFFAGENQKLDRCVDAVLDLREMLSRLYSGQIDEFGFIKVESDSALRIETQNSKDTALILCTGISALSGPEELDVERNDTWQNAPLTYTAAWSAQDVEELYAWTGRALDALRSESSLFG